MKTASRTKFFIEFYSTCLEEYKKSFENDAQSSDNINFLKVQWSSRQLPTVRLHAGPGFVGEAQREVQQSEFGEGRQRQQSAHISMHVVG